MTFLVSACTVIARAIAPGVRSSEQPLAWEPSPESCSFSTKWYLKTIVFVSVLCNEREGKGLTWLGTPLNERNKLVLEWIQIVYIWRTCDTIDMSSIATHPSQSDCRPIRHGSVMDDLCPVEMIRFICLSWEEVHFLPEYPDDCKDKSQIRWGV